jgi:hypothetical protein
MSHQLLCQLQSKIESLERKVNTLESIFDIAPSYASMQSRATGDKFKIFVVLDDEVKATTRTVYIHIPTVGVNYIVSLDEL